MIGADLLGFQTRARRRQRHAAIERIIHNGESYTGTAHARDAPRSTPSRSRSTSATGHRSAPLPARAPPRQRAAARRRLRLRSASTGSTTRRASTNACGRSASCSTTACSTRSAPGSCRSSVPSRGDVADYDDERDEVEQLVADDQRAPSARPTAPARCSTSPRSSTRRDLAGWYRAADCLVVTSLRRRDEPRRQGVRGDVAPTSAARWCCPSSPAPPTICPGALIVNPYDTDAVKRAMLRGRAG